MAQEIESIALSSTTPSVGDVLTYTVTPAEAVTSCLWYRDTINNTNVIGNESSYTVKKEDMGHIIICYVSGVRSDTENSWYGSERAETEEIEAKIDAEKTVHFRGGPGITIIADGDCEHATETKVAKINWDGICLKQEYDGTVREPLWFRGIKAGTNITLNVANDQCTISALNDYSAGDGILIYNKAIFNDGILEIVDYPNKANPVFGVRRNGEGGRYIYVGKGIGTFSFGDTVGHNGIGVKTVRKTVLTGITSNSSTSITFTTETIDCVDTSGT